MEPMTMMAAATVLSAGLGYMGSQSANNADRVENEVNRGFQERMRSTAHQAEVQDLEAAGLNPILSGLGGSGAAQPSGSVPGPMRDPTSDGLKQGISTAFGLANLKQDLELKEANTDLMHDQATNLAQTRGLMVQQQKGHMIQNESSEIQKNMLKQVVPSMIKKAKAEGDYAEVNQLMGVLKSGASTASDIKDLANPLTLPKSGK